MWSLLVSALIVCACVEVLQAQFYPGFHGPMGYGGLSFDDMDDDIPTESLLLNCFASFKDANGKLDNELAVTIEGEGDDDDIDDRLLGFGGFSQPGFGAVSHTGYGYGPYGSTFNNGGFPGNRQRSGSKLSAHIQFFSPTKSGRAFVVFTERARVEDGCSIENFGDVLTRDKIDREENRGLGRPLGLQGGLGYHHGYGHGIGYPRQLGYGAGYGYGGYGGNFGSMYGMGLGVGAGFGMGTMGLLQEDSDPQYDDGVVTELDIRAGALTSAVVDDVGFDDLSDLAGRGVLICSDIEYDWDWNPRCTEPTFSCCALKYDNVRIALVN